MTAPSAGPLPGRSGLFTGASVTSRSFEAFVAAAAISLGTYVAVHLPARSSPLGVWPVILVTAAAGIAAVAPGGLFTVPTGQKTFRNPGSGAVFAILLALPLRQALPIAFCGMAAAQLLRRYYRRDRLTWQTIAFNLAQYVVTWTLAGATFTRVRLDLAAWPPAARWPVAVVCAGVVYILVNTWLVAVWNALRRRAVAWDLWVHTLSHLVSTRWIPLGIGAYAARLAGHHPVLAFDTIALSWVAYWAASRVSDTRLRELASPFGAMVEAAERRWPEFAEHSERVSWLAERLARHLGASDHDAATIGVAAKLHDLGKVAMGIPIGEDGDRGIESAAIVRFHPVVAGDALMRGRGFETVARYLRSQSEWYDGSGHPDGRARNAIPLASRIIAVADAYDTARCRHRHIQAGAAEQALEHVHHEVGARFDPVVVHALDAVVSVEATSRVYSRAFSRGSGPVMLMAFAGAPAGVVASEARPGADPIQDYWERDVAEVGRLSWDPLSSRDRRRSKSHLDTQEAERRYLARELHDEIGGELTQLSCALKAAPACASGCTVHNAQSIVQTLIERVRNLSLDLRPFILDDLGLAAALGWYTEKFASRTGIRVRFTDTGLERRFDPTVETAAYRIVQEALTNSAKHGRASEITVVAESGYGVLTISVRDNGTGFDPEVIRKSGRVSGTVGMRERAMLIGGALKITSQLGSGTRIDVSLPAHVAGSWKHVH